ncbi:pseudouridine synthase [Aliiroseovarius sp. 2305UL8-7]|uniref:pseudouridine synthase n=1 Tax=Aliiroseovarius conchicola TaxID=3121637 RepID=UPI0035278420
MTDKKRPPVPKTARKPAPQKPEAAKADPSKGDRIAKVLARAGVASRREAERMIEAGRVTVNGKVIDSPALNVTDKDVILFDEAPLAAPEPPRMWLYYKPIGLVTTERDEKGRDTVFAALPEDMPRVMSVGRLDINSEGLLLLTNDGEVKRKLELPSTGWSRKYRVRVNGRPTDDTLAPVRKGITVDGERFQPMSVSLDRQQGANAWLTISLREGKNREIRRAMEAVGLSVNRLLRVSYGPFQLAELKPGEVEEIRQRVVRDHLGLEDAKPVPVRTRSEIPRGKHGSKPGAKPAAKRSGRATGKPDGKTSGKPAERPAGKNLGGNGSRGRTNGGRPQGRPGPRKK